MTQLRPSAIAAVLLLAVFAQAPFRGGQSRTDLKDSATNRSRKPGSSSTQQNKEIPRESPWDAICTVAQRVSPRHSLKGEGCLNAFAAAHKKTAVLMAAIPHPLRTHLDMWSDRELDTLNSAASGNHFLFDGYWLPWPRSSATASSNSRQALPQVAQDEPGLLIYRSSFEKKEKPATAPDFLFVFLVPETPVSGLDTDVFLNTLSYAEKIYCNSQPEHSRDCGTKSNYPRLVRLIGPNFSGSLNSLESITAKLPDTTCVYAVSGTITAPSQEFLKDHTPPDLGFKCGDHLAFSAVQTSDAEVSEDFINYLRPDLNHPKYKKHEIAILKEGVTAYGTQNVQMPTKPEEKKITDDGALVEISFPRDIWRVRNASPASKSETIPAKNSPEGQAQPLVSNLDLTDPVEHDDDSLPMYAAHTPLTQEAILLDIALRLRESHVKIALILATNPLDSLYLLRFLHRACPDVRFVTRDADMLYSRPDAVSLTGVLSLSNFTLTHSIRSGPIPIFPDSNQVGVYFAANHQMEGALTHSWTTNEVTRPVVLDAIGNGEFWPIASISSRQPDFDRSQIMQDHDLIRTTLVLLIILSFVHLIAVLWTPRTRFFHTECNFLGDPSLALRKAVCHQAGLGALLGLQVTISSSFLWANIFNLWSLFLVASLTALAAGYLNFLVKQVFIPGFRNFFHEKPVVRISARFYTLVAAILFAIHVWYFWNWYRIASPANYDVASFHLRSLSPVSGLSPTLPLCSFLLLFYLASLGFIQRITYVEYRFPTMPTKDLDPVLPTHFNSCYCKLRDIFSWILVGGQWFFIFLALFIGAIVFLSPGKYVESLENYTYDKLVLALLTCSIFAVLLTWLRIFAAWASLHRILSQLERLPIYAAFSRMPQAPVFSFWQANSSSSFLMLSESLETIRSIRTKRPDLIREPLYKQFEKALREFYSKVHITEERAFAAAASPVSLAVRASTGKRVHSHDSIEPAPVENATPCKPPVEQLDKLKSAESVLLKIVDELLLPNGSLLRYWAASRNSHRRMDDEKNDKPSTPPVDEAVLLAEDLVTMRFYTLIRYVLTEMRNLLVLVIAIFTMTIFALKCYPFRAHSAINWALIAIFLVISALTMKIFAEMDRDSILSRIAGTTPGKISPEFYIKVLTYGAIPLLSIVTAQFPSISSFLFSWLQPTLEAIK